MELPSPEETEALLQDVLAFLEDAAWSDTFTTSSLGPKKRRKTPRDSKKAEKETLRSQITQYETQLELLRLQKPPSSTKTPWEWLGAAIEEEERRQKAEEVNRQLKSILTQQFATLRKLQKLIIQQPALAQRVQELMTKSSPSVTITPTVTFQSLRAIAAYVKMTVDQLRTDFSGWNSLDEALMSSVNVQNGDPPFLELRSATPLACRYEEGVRLLWDMLLEKKVLGSSTSSYRIKTKQLTQSSAEFGYSTNDSGLETLNGVTLFEKSEEESHTIVLWASMMVEPDGKPFCSSRGYLSVTRLPSNPQQESLVRSSSRLAGKLFGLSGRSPKTRQHLIASKTRLEHAQLRIMERAELQVG
ncbi:hypothetical protein V7S43_003831 [Phytophthora oleae]|uniref:M96 mating-specific protein family n=1 Tax=Phytophthora oleae TaxID=2107226 RepID=A0ABD3G0A7_9STRA